MFVVFFFQQSKENASSSSPKVTTAKDLATEASENKDEVVTNGNDATFDTLEDMDTSINSSASLNGHDEESETSQDIAVTKTEMNKKECEVSA
jgi:hypothetical protein